MGRCDMTLRELERMRMMRAVPAMPITLTDDPGVHEFCTGNDLPVIWTPGLADDADLSPLVGLRLWLIPVGKYWEILERVKAHRPKTMWVAGRYGFAHRINDAVGREVVAW